jgi:hypothetical protein
LLHLQILPEISLAIQMMRYTVNQDPRKNKDFKIFFPFLISFMKLTGGILTELINGFKMSTAETIEDVVKDFIAFEIISQVDNFVVYTMTIDVQEVIGKWKPSFTDYNGKDRKEHQYFALFLYKILHYLYLVVYFYYFPILILGFVYAFGDGDTQRSSLD